MKRAMDKVFIKLYIPVVETYFDVKIPLDKKIYKIIYLLIKSIYDLTEGAYMPQTSPHLYDKWSAFCYDDNLTVRECNIKNGAELILL